MVVATPEGMAVAILVAKGEVVNLGAVVVRAAAIPGRSWPR